MQDRINALDVCDADKIVIRKVGELRDLLRRGYGSPRARELQRTLDDFTSELTGDREFFHQRGHKSP